VASGCLYEHCLQHPKTVRSTLEHSGDPRDGAAGPADKNRNGPTHGKRWVVYDWCHANGGTLLIVLTEPPWTLDVALRTNRISSIIDNSTTLASPTEACTYNKAHQKAHRVLGYGTSRLRINNSFSAPRTEASSIGGPLRRARFFGRDQAGRCSAHLVVCCSTDWALPRLAVARAPEVACLEPLRMWRTESPKIRAGRPVGRSR